MTKKSYVNTAFQCICAMKSNIHSSYNSIIQNNGYVREDKKKNIYGKK